MLDARLKAAYEATEFRVQDSPCGPLVIRIGERNPALDRLLEHLGEEVWAYITACNPGLRRITDEENLRRMSDLDRAFDRGLITVDGDLTMRMSRRLEQHRPDDVVEKMFVAYRGDAIKLPEKFQPEAAFLEYHRDVVFYS